MPDWISRQLELQGLTPWWAATGHLLAVSVAAGLILVLHRYERQLVSRAVGRALLGLRLAVLGLALVVFLQPVQSWTINERRSGRIVVGIDQSQSMQATDPQASRGEKLRWTRGLGMIGNEASDERLDAWQAAFDRNEEPAWADDADDPDPRRRDELAAARKENLLDLFAEVSGISRLEMARRLLLSTPNPLLKELQKLAMVELFVFGGKAEVVAEGQLERALAEPSATVQTELTDLAEGLKNGPQPGASSPILGIVLFTDGRQTAPANPLPSAQALGRLRVPIYPVMMGTTRRPKDLAIPSLDAPSTVYRNDKPLVKAVLQTSGFEGQTLTVELRPAEEERSDEAQIRTITPDGPLTPIEFELPSREVGRYTYVLSLPAEEGETHADNNARSFTLAVVDDRARVLLVDGQPRWEFRYLEAAFSRDERVDLKVALFQQPYLGLLPEPFFPRALPASASPFEDLDVVILGDVAPWQLKNEHWEQLEAFVSENGGTLVLSAGKEYLPKTYRLPTMERLLPVSTASRVDLTQKADLVPPSRQGLRLELTPEGSLQSMFHLAPEAEENRRTWERLPGPFWAWLGKAKPAATVWVTAVPPERGRLDDERHEALVVHQHYGFGQVVWIGFDSTWRWRHRVGDRYHHQFWGQLVRWGASNKIAAGNEFVRFGPEETEVESGRDVTLRARWSPPFLERFPELSARAELSRVGGDVIAVVDLAPKKNQKVLWEGRAIALPAGDYRARLVATNGELGRRPVEASFSVRPPNTPELMDATANRELLAEIAEASGGRLLRADELDELPRLLRPDETTAELYRETPLWDHGIVLVLFFALLTGEWMLRKWNGLP
jgi:hypothetical protein